MLLYLFSTLISETSYTENLMEPYDDDLSRFAADGAAPLPVADETGYVDHDGAGSGMQRTEPARL